MNWKLENKIDKIFDRYVKEIPYEGKEVDSSSIKEEMNTLYEGIMKGLITYMKNYSWDTNGWKNEDGIYNSREKIIEEFYKEM